MFDSTGRARQNFRTDSSVWELNAGGDRLEGRPKNIHDENDPYYSQLPKTDWVFFDYHDTPTISQQGVVQRPRWIHRGTQRAKKLNVFPVAHTELPPDKKKLASCFHFTPTDTTSLIEDSFVLAIHWCHQSRLVWFITIIFCDCIFPYARDPSMLTILGWQHPAQLH